MALVKQRTPNPAATNYAYHLNGRWDDNRATSSPPQGKKGSQYYEATVDVVTAYGEETLGSIVRFRCEVIFKLPAVTSVGNRHRDLDN